MLLAFSEHLVKNGPLPKEIGRLLKQAETRRYVADYESDSIELDSAQEMVEQVVFFVETIQNQVFAAPAST